MSNKPSIFEVRGTQFSINRDGVTVVAGIICKRGERFTISEPDYYKTCTVDLDGEHIGVLTENEGKLLKAFIHQQNAIIREQLAGLAA